MNYQEYDPEVSETWKNRYTIKDLQTIGTLHRILILLAVGIATLISLASTTLALVYIPEDASWLHGQIRQSTWMKISILLATLTLIIIAIIYAISHTHNLLKKIYLPKDGENTLKLLKNKILMPRAKLPGFLNALTHFPFIIIQSVESVDKNHWAYWFGGPVLLIIYDGFAVYVERGNQFSRVLGPGLPAPVLENYEHIRAVVDLRPIEKNDSVEAWTKDGIKIKASVKITVQILSSEKAKKQSVVLKEEEGKTNLIYPFDPDNVKKIVEGTAVLLDGETKELNENNWHTAAMGSVTGKIKAYISGQSMSELITWDEKSPQLLSFKISKELFDDLKVNLANSGKDLLDLQITDFKPNKQEISDLLIAYWKTKHERDKILQEAEAEATRILRKQDARTQAYANFFEDILENPESFFPNSSQSSTESFTEASLILLASVFDKDNDPMMGSFTTREILKTLEQLREQLNKSQKKL